MLPNGSTGTPYDSSYCFRPIYGASSSSGILGFNPSMHYQPPYLQSPVGAVFHQIPIPFTMPQVLPSASTPLPTPAMVASIPRQGTTGIATGERISAPRTIAPRMVAQTMVGPTMAPQDMVGTMPAEGMVQLVFAQSNITGPYLEVAAATRAPQATTGIVTGEMAMAARTSAPLTGQTTAAPTQFAPTMVPQYMVGTMSAQGMVVPAVAQTPLLQQHAGRSIVPQTGRFFVNSGHVENQLRLIQHFPATFAMQEPKYGYCDSSRQGTFQDLLRKVSTPNWSYQVLDVPTSLAVTEETMGQEIGTSASEPDNVIDDEEEDSIRGEDEDNFHDADDEGSQLMEEEAENERVANIDVTADVSEEATAYEFAPINSNGSVIKRKRRRFPKGYKIPECRERRDIGTIEKAMRNASKRGEGHIFEPKLGMVFDSRAEAYKFYNLYSWEVGFGIRFGSFAKNRVNQMRTMQEIVCEKEGFDKRCKNSTKRIRCKAMIRLHQTEDFGWYVSKHVAQHNHPVSVSWGEKREWNSHSRIENCTKEMIGYLRDSNVSLRKVHCFMGNMYGSMEDVPFNERSLRAVCSRIARDQKSDDISKTIEVFRKMRAQDPGFQFSVDFDEEKKVKSLIWATGRSRSQYNFFGDAITFDTTYCTNIYKMPFGMFVGVNNHFQSIIFAGVLVTREDTESFKWVFKEFITLMGGKHPITILTDQCKAMTKAIRLVFTDYTTHLWCKWHVLRDAPQEVGPLYNNNEEFRTEFHFVIGQMLTIDEFERGWDHLLSTYNLRDNEFMQRTYEKRQMWAKPWARHTFCARMASTQRSESANNILKNVVPRNSSMNRFVEQYNKMLFLRARAEEKAEHDTKQFVHRTKRMYQIEKHAIKVYTKKCFELFSEEVDKATEYEVEETQVENVFQVVHNNAETRKKWARVIFMVRVEDECEKFLCECGQFDHFGMLCCHAIKVMLHCKVHKIPQYHIVNRWTREARDYEYPKEACGEIEEQLSKSLMYANALDVVKRTEKAPKAGEILTRHLNLARQEIERLQSETITNGSETNENIFSSYATGSGEEDYNTDQNVYSSIGQPVGKNIYGASGSSAYMSDVEIRQMKAPVVPQKQGRKREKRYKRMFERRRTTRKRYTGSTVICENCESDCEARIDTTAQVGSQSKKKSKKGKKKVAD